MARFGSTPEEHKKRAGHAAVMRRKSSRAFWVAIRAGKCRPAYQSLIHTLAASKKMATEASHYGRAREVPRDRNADRRMTEAFGTKCIIDY